MFKCKRDHCFLYKQRCKKEIVMSNTVHMHALCRIVLKVQVTLSSKWSPFNLFFCTYIESQLLIKIIIAKHTFSSKT